MDKRTLLTLTITIVVLTMSRHAAATEDEKPFDPYSCWCVSKFLDVSIGHFDDTNIDKFFIIDVPVWNEGVMEDRLPGTTLDVVYSLGGKKMPFLIFDSSWYNGQWCFQPVDSHDPDTILLRDTACGWVNPLYCEHQATLSQVVKFSKAALFGDMKCREAADKYLGMGRETGCASGTSSWWALLGLLSFHTVRRTRRSPRQGAM